VAASDDNDTPVIRQWPPDEPLDPETAMMVTCPDCGGPWRVHPDLAGFRLRCDCGAWITMPARQEATSVSLPFEQEGEVVAAEEQLDDQGRVEMPMQPGEVSDTAMPTHVPLAPGALQHANVETRQRWTNRAFLELSLMMAAFLLPWLFVSLMLEGRAHVLAMPFVSMFTGIVIVLLAAASSPYAFTGLRRSPGRFFAEGALGAAAGAALALGWSQLTDPTGQGDASLRDIVDALGWGWTFFVIALCPALFEEVAFRGAVQGRFSALLGRNQGILLTGTAFGLCHGITTALPLHIGLGVWLCWLRERSASLLPGILAHAIYNGLIVLSA